MKRSSVYHDRLKSLHNNQAHFMPNIKNEFSGDPIVFFYFAESFRHSEQIVSHQLRISTNSAEVHSKELTLSVPLSVLSSN